jgi:hypothetical protein
MGCIKPDGFVQGSAPGWEGYPRPKEIDVGEIVAAASPRIRLQAYAFMTQRLTRCQSTDYGVPIDESCHETGEGTGVFTRKWSKATATMDCNAYTGKIEVVAQSTAGPA